MRPATARRRRRCRTAAASTRGAGASTIVRARSTSTYSPIRGASSKRRRLRRISGSRAKPRSGSRRRPRSTHSSVLGRSSTSAGSRPPIASRSRRLPAEQRIVGRLPDEAREAQVEERERHAQRDAAGAGVSQCEQRRPQRVLQLAPAARAVPGPHDVVPALGRADAAREVGRDPIRHGEGRPACRAAGRGARAAARPAIARGAPRSSGSPPNPTSSVRENDATRRLISYSVDWLGAMPGSGKRQSPLAGGRPAQVLVGHEVLERDADAVGDELRVAALLLGEELVVDDDVRAQLVLAAARREHVLGRGGDARRVHAAAEVRAGRARCAGGRTRPRRTARGSARRAPAGAPACAARRPAAAPSTARHGMSRRSPSARGPAGRCGCRRTSCPRGPSSCRTAGSRRSRAR